MSDTSLINTEFSIKNSESLDIVIRDLLKFLSHKFNTSSELLENNIQDSNYNLIRDFITNPLKSNYENFMKSQYAIFSILDRLFKNAIFQDGLKVLLNIYFIRTIFLVSI